MSMLTKGKPVKSAPEVDTTVLRTLMDAGYPRAYALSALQSLPVATRPAQAYLKALAKCQQWVSNPFLPDCPPVGASIAAFPSHWKPGQALPAEDLAIAAQEYNESAGIFAPGVENS